MATWETYKDSEFHFRLQKLIIDGGTAVARNIFDNRLGNIPLSGFLARGRLEINHLRRLRIITQSQYDQLYPQGVQAHNTNSKDFDLTLIICLLRNLPSLGLNQYLFRIPPDQRDLSLVADLTRLKSFRNEILHMSSTTTFDEPTFDTKWTEITQTLLRLNDGPHSDSKLEQTIDLYKNAPLEPDADKKYHDAFVKELKTDIRDLRTDIQDVEVEVDEINKTNKRDTEETECQDAFELKKCYKELEDKFVEIKTRCDEGMGKETILKWKITSLEKCLNRLRSKLEKVLTKTRDADDGKAPDSQVTPKKAPRPPGDACLFDGRLIKLAATDIDDLQKCCTKLIGKGGFGKVYASEKSLDQFGMQIAVRKCGVLDGSVRREMFASRIMNPFILPLLAVEKIDEEIWFVSPYFEGGDLLLAIENDRAPKEIKMNQLTRLKILLQIAFAIQYIHTEIYTIRDVTLHKDICSKNVVLEENYNARLIDFGLAREKTDDTSHARGPKFAYHHPSIEDNETATESWDYYAFGVVIREMLTGFPPTGSTATKFLKKLTEEEISKHSKGSTVWSSEVEQELNKIADDCLDVTHFKKEVVDKIKGSTVWSPELEQELNKIADDCLDVTHFKNEVVDKIKGSTVWSPELEQELNKIADDCLDVTHFKNEVVDKIKESKVWTSEVAQKFNKIAADCLDVTHKEWNVTNFKNEVVAKIKGSTVWSSEVAQKLNKIAADCLDETHKEWNVTNFKNEVVDKIKDICRECIILKFLDLSEDQQKRCHSCIINPVAKESSLKKDHRANCTQKIEVCIACEKNSFLNPITCYCGTELKPCIGSGWGALLVAGNHSDNSAANAMTQDVKELKRVITSKAPRIMGISEENVRIVVPAKPGKPLSGAAPETKLRQEVMSKLSDIGQDKIDTLLVYFSCKGIKDDADEHNGTFRFQLAPEEDSIPLHEFTTALNKLANVNNLIVFLDCCNAPLLSDIGKKKLLQITSCKENETAKVIDKSSTFTKYIIQGLKAKSEKTCIEECHHCKQYWQTQDSFISAHSLFCYVKNHTGSKTNIPNPDIKMVSEFPLAFYTAEPVEIDFTFEEKKTEKRIPLEYLETMDQLEEKLRKEFGKDETVKVTINKKTYRKRDEKKEEECSSLDQVMSAWVQRHPLYVSFQAARG